MMIWRKRVVQLFLFIYLFYLFIYLFESDHEGP